MTTSADKLITVIENIKSKAVHGFTDLDILKINNLVLPLLQRQDTLMAAIAIGKLCPAAVDLNNIIDACKTHNPLLLDELMHYPGVDTLRLQESILGSFSLPQSLDRVTLWYPNSEELPFNLQMRISHKMYSRVISEVTEGPMHKRELSAQTGALFEKTLNWVGSKLQANEAVFPLLRGAHYILRGMSRIMELHHQLSDTFIERSFNAVWTHALQRNDQASLVNAVALTLSNRDLFPEALSYLAINHPKAYALVQPEWNDDSKDITKFINSLKKNSGMDSTIVSRGASAEMSF